MWGLNMENNIPKDISTFSTSGVENYVESVKSVENSKINVENSMIKIPFIVYESEMTRNERDKKRLYAVIICLCIALIMSIIIAFVDRIEINNRWLMFLEQYNFESYDYSQDGQGVNIIGNENGVDYNGATTESSQND